MTASGALPVFPSQVELESRTGEWCDDLPPSDTDHRRVLAVLRYLEP